MKNLKLLLALTFLVTTFTTQVSAQPYPITSTTQLTTPQLPQLEALADPTNNTVFLSLILNDITQPQYNLRLRLIISGNGISIETDAQAFLPSPINLQYNVPVLLNGADLSAYFKLDNLRFNGISKAEYLRLGSLPEGLYSVCFEAYDYNRFLEPPVSNRSCATSNLEVHDPPVLVNPIGEQPMTTPQQLQFNWQNRHIGAFPVEYELRIYEKRAWLTDDQVLVSMPPLFRVVTRVPTYSYGLKDPLLKEAQEYLTVVQIRDATDKNFFKNFGNSKPETFVLKTPCRPGLACSDNDDCTINDTYDKDCNCVGKPIYDPNEDGLADPVIIPPPTIIKPNNEICVNDGKSVIAWTPNHDLNIKVQYELSIWLDKIDVKQTEDYLNHRQELEAPLTELLANQREEYSRFIMRQQEPKAQFTKELQAIENSCIENAEKALTEYLTKQKTELAEFEQYLADLSQACEKDPQAAQAMFEAELKAAQAAFDAKQATDKKEFTADLTAEYEAFTKKHNSEYSAFKDQQEPDFEEFLRVQANSKVTKEANFQANMATVKKVFEALEVERERCMEEADDYKNTVWQQYLANIAPVQKQIGMTNLMVQNLEIKFENDRTKLGEQLEIELDETQDKEEREQIQSTFYTQLRKMEADYEAAVVEQKAKKVGLNKTIDSFKDEREAALAKSKETIELMRKTCDVNYENDLKNAEAQQKSIEAAYSSDDETEQIAFRREQELASKAFSIQHKQDFADFETKQKNTTIAFDQQQKTDATNFFNKLEQRRRSFKENIKDCKAFIAQESGYFSRKQAEDKAAYERKTAQRTSDCVNSTTQDLADFTIPLKKEEADFLAKQAEELAGVRENIAAELKSHENELQTQYRQEENLPKLVYKEHEINKLHN